MPPGGKTTYPEWDLISFFRTTPGGRLARGGNAGKNSPQHTRAHFLEQEMDKIDARAFRDKRLGGDDKKAHASDGLAPSVVGFFDTKRMGPKPRESREPRFKLRLLQGGRG